MTNGMEQSINALDWGILEWIQSSRGPALDWLMPKVTALGNVGLVWIVLALMLICSKRYRTCGVAMAAALVLGLLLGNMILKPLVGRIRPFDVNPDIVLLIRAPLDYSFPSMHTCSSVACAGVLWRRNRGWGTCAAVLAAAIAFSRLYLQVHYPTDVLAGMVLGLMCAYLGMVMVKKGSQVWSRFHG